MSFGMCGWMRRICGVSHPKKAPKAKNHTPSPSA